MIDIQKQIEYWRTGASAEREFAAHLFGEGRMRHALFFLHLMLEKLIKAHVCKATKDLAPKDHHLVRLAGKAMLPVSGEDKAFLATITRFNIEGRYPDSYEEVTCGGINRKNQTRK
jgi:HEPN domain-containing protein